MSHDERYKQLALFSLIVAEVVLTPLTLGGALYFLAQKSSAQVWIALIGGVVGLILAFYRISQMMKRKGNHEPHGK